MLPLRTSPTRWEQRTVYCYVRHKEKVQGNCAVQGRLLPRAKLSSHIDTLHETHIHPTQLLDRHDYTLILAKMPRSDPAGWIPG